MRVTRSPSTSRRSVGDVIADVRLRLAVRRQRRVSRAPNEVANWNVPVSVPSRPSTTRNEGARRPQLRRDDHAVERGLAATTSLPAADTLTVDVYDNELADVLIVTAGTDGLDVVEVGATETFGVVLASGLGGGHGHFANGAQTTSPVRHVHPAELGDLADGPVTAVDDDVDETALHPGAITFGVTTSASGYVDGHDASWWRGSACHDRLGRMSATTTRRGCSDSTTNVDAHRETARADTFTIVLGSEPTESVRIALVATGLCTVCAGER